MNNQKAYYQNPKRSAYHQAGHLTALYLLTGSLNLPAKNGTTKDNGVQDRPQFSTTAGYQQIFYTVCIGVAGAVAEMIHCQYSGVPQNSLEDDFDNLQEVAKVEWGLKFKKNRSGFLHCPALEHLTKSAADFLACQLREFDNLAKVKEVTRYLIENNLALPDLTRALQENTPEAQKAKKDILHILRNYTFSDYEKELSAEIEKSLCHGHV